MILSVAALLIGFLLDALIGDPHHWPHPVKWIGAGIARGEKFLRTRFPATPRGEMAAGIFLSICTIAISTALPALLLFITGKAGVWLWFAADAFMTYQIFAARSLQKESMKVYKALAGGDLPLARMQVSMIVGRDTEQLDEKGVVKAAVETIAENTSDGVLAPMIYLAAGNAPFGFFYKAVNTLDSMIGYKNDRYLFFGRFAAKLDDVLNFIPARVSALFMVAAAFVLRMDYKNAWRIYLRDRKCHASPNSAHTEAVCAGALGVQLAGDASYFGKTLRKPTIGDALREIEPEDICRANRLMYGSSILLLIMVCAVRACVLFWVFGGAIWQI